MFRLFEAHFDKLEQNGGRIMLALNPVNLAILIVIVGAVIVLFGVISCMLGEEAEDECEDED